MIFKGPANTKFNLKGPFRYGEPSAIRFSADGLYETHNKFLARRLARKFEIVTAEPEQSEPQEQPQEVTLKKCKKCDFTCDNQGDLMRHYKTEHPKEN